MRSVNRFWAVLLCFIAPVALAQEVTRTDAQWDGVRGPVKSVSTSVTKSAVKWLQPRGPTLVMPIWCSDCDYDIDGNRTRSGVIVGGVFQGEIVQAVRGADGRVAERIFISATTGEVLKRDVMGPFGRVEETNYIDGAMKWHQTLTYDQYGHLADWRTFDASGKQVGRSLRSTDKDGTLRETSVWGENGELRWRQTFDPETQTEHFSSFDSDGIVKLTSITLRGEPIRFWEREGLPQEQEFGDTLTTDRGKGNVDVYVCHSDGRCDFSRVHYEWLDSDKRDPLSAEWRDSEGNLQRAGYCEYEVDSFNNWTNRKVWVWSPELGERTLLETDSRTITYWRK